MEDLSTYLDSQLVFLLKKGSRTAFSEIFHRYQPLLYRFTYKKIQEEEASKDVVQDVFIRLWNNRETLADSTKLPNYLFRAVSNRSLDWLKSQVIRTEYVTSFQHVLDNFDESADYRIRHEEMDRLIEAEVAALPDRMRTVINLRRQKYLTNREIATHLGISEQTVETHFKRAFRVLRRRLLQVVPAAYLLHWWSH